jgi:hypothetical protein
MFSPRLFVLSSSGDSAAQYMNYMNAFFTAQVRTVNSVTFLSSVLVFLYCLVSVHRYTTGRVRDLDPEHNVRSEF